MGRSWGRVSKDWFTKVVVRMRGEHRRPGLLATDENPPGISDGAEGP